MAFIFLFVVGTLTFPLLVETYRRGSDNIIARSGKEILESKLLTGAAAKLNRMLSSLGDFFSGAVAGLSLLIVAGLIFGSLRLILQVIMKILGGF